MGPFIYYSLASILNCNSLYIFGFLFPTQQSPRPPYSSYSYRDCGAGQLGSRDEGADHVGLRFELVYELDLLSLTNDIDALFVFDYQ